MKRPANALLKAGYTFQVLMDIDDKGVQQCKVKGLPIKFVIDGNGVIHFKSVGYKSSKDAMMAERAAMIDLATINRAKAFKNIPELKRKNLILPMRFLMILNGFNPNTPRAYFPARIPGFPGKINR